MYDCLYDYFTASIDLQQRCDDFEILDIESYLAIRMHTSAVYPTVSMYLYGPRRHVSMICADRRTHEKFDFSLRTTRLVLLSWIGQRSPPPDEHHDISVRLCRFRFGQTCQVTYSYRYNDIVSARHEIVRLISTLHESVTGWKRCHRRPATLTISSLYSCITRDLPHKKRPISELRWWGRHTRVSGHLNRSSMLLVKRAISPPKWMHSFKAASTFVWVPYSGRKYLYRTELFHQI